MVDEAREFSDEDTVDMAAQSPDLLNGAGLDPDDAFLGKMYEWEKGAATMERQSSLARRSEAKTA